MTEECRFVEPIRRQGVVKTKFPGRVETKTQSTIEVAAGVIFRDDKLLIAQRCAGAHLEGLWEFPGGKRRPEETFEACLVRELREELGITVEVGQLLERLTHRYPEKRVHLEFFRCQWKGDEPQALGCAAFQWIAREELETYTFPAADQRLIQRLRSDWRLCC